MKQEKHVKHLKSQIASPIHMEYVAKMTRRYLLCALAALGMLLTENSRAIQITNEYWISTNASTANLGTLAEPFDGSTQSLFDNRMNNLPPACTIHILAGVYSTAGTAAWLVKSGQKLLGSGIDVTIVRLLTNSPDNTCVILSYYGTNNTVSDLTVDCNYSSGNVTYSGVNLYGTRHTVSRVKVVNASGGTGEAFQIAIGSSNWGIDLNSEGNIIEECEVSSFHGGFCSAIACNGGPTSWISGVVRHNRIFLAPAFPTASEFQIAINGANAINYLVEGNYVNGATAAFYGDTGTYTNLTVANNFFINVYSGVSIAGGGVRKNMSFQNNHIEITNNTSYSTYGILLNGGPICTNVSVSGNSVQYAWGGTGALGIGIYAATVLGLTAANNTVDSALANYFVNCTNYYAYNNLDLAGNLLTDFNQVEPANGVVRRIVTTNSTLKYSDRYIGARPASTVYLTNTLPSAVGRSGKEIVIADEAGNAAQKSIFIRTTSPDQINGGTQDSITTAYGAKTVISDGTNWFSR